MDFSSSMVMYFAIFPLLGHFPVQIIYCLRNCRNTLVKMAPSLDIAVVFIYGIVFLLIGVLLSCCCFVIACRRHQLQQFPFPQHQAYPNTTNHERDHHTYQVYDDCETDKHIYESIEDGHIYEDVEQTSAQL